MQNIKDNGWFSDMSPDTKRELTKEEGKFSWLRSMKEKLDQKWDEWKSPFDPKNFYPSSEVDLLNMENINTLPYQSKKYDKTIHRFFFEEKEQLKNIAANDILNEYPIFRISNTITRSIDSIERSHLRAAEAKTTSFENAVKQVNDLVSRLSKFKLYSLDCDNVIITHQTLFEYSKNAEEKEQYVREILKLRDQLLEHERAVYDTVYDMNNINITNHKTFTSPFVNSEYSLTEEEARWWNKTKSEAFRELKMYESLGIVQKEILQFKTWKESEEKEIAKYPIKDHVERYQKNEINKEVDKVLNDILDKIERDERNKIFEENYRKELESLLPKDLIEDFIIWKRDSAEAYEIRPLSGERIIEQSRFVKEFFNHKIHIPLIHEMINNAVDQVENNQFHQEEMLLIGEDV